MHKVIQTKLGDEGNCFAAVIASLLELPIAQVPQFEEMAKTAWPIAFVDLMQKNGLYTLMCEIDPVLPTPYIACGKSPRGLHHAVIYQNGAMVHDPHPSGEGIATPEYFYHFTPLETVDLMEAEMRKLQQKAPGRVFDLRLNPESFSPENRWLVMEIHYPNRPAAVSGSCAHSPIASIRKAIAQLSQTYEYVMSPH